MGLLTDIGRVLIKLSENDSPHMLNEDIQKITAMLRFIAESVLYGSIFALLGIGLASLYAGWMGMAVLMIVVSLLLFFFGFKKYSAIIGTKKKAPWSQLILYIGFFLLAIALMSIIDSSSVQISKPIPTPTPYWEVYGIIGMVLVVGWFCSWLIRR